MKPLVGVYTTCFLNNPSVLLTTGDHFLSRPCEADKESSKAYVFVNTEIFINECFEEELIIRAFPMTEDMLADIRSVSFDCNAARHWIPVNLKNIMPAYDIIEGAEAKVTRT